MQRLSVHEEKTKLCREIYQSPESMTRLLRRVGSFNTEKNNVSYRHV